MTVRRVLQASFIAAGFWGLLSPFAQADWGGFYTSTQQSTQKNAETNLPVQNVCLREILLAQTRHNIPQNILLGIGLQEAGTRINEQLVVWPWAINAEGQGHLFDTKVRAMNWVQEQLTNGMRSIDVGCMQVNLRWHPDAFNNLVDAFSPKINVEYAARLLKSHYQATGDWLIAAGRYHSKTPEKQQIYLLSLKRNIRVANARIDTFKILAGLNPSGVPQNVEQVASSAKQRFFWTSALTARGESGTRAQSIYSLAGLQPILPNFRREP